jgi:hypothetical protein
VLQGIPDRLAAQQSCQRNPASGPGRQLNDVDSVPIRMLGVIGQVQFARDSETVSFIDQWLVRGEVRHCLPRAADR